MIVPFCTSEPVLARNSCKLKYHRMAKTFCRSLYNVNLWAIYTLALFSCAVANLSLGTSASSRTARRSSRAVCSPYRQSLSTWSWSARGAAVAAAATRGRCCKQQAKNSSSCIVNNKKIQRS